MDKDLKKLLYQTLLGIIILIFLIVFLSHFIKEPISKVSKVFVDLFGITGVGLGIFVADSLPAFLIPDTFLIFAIAGELDDLPVLIVSGIGSVAGGSFSYWQGKMIYPKIKFIRKFIHSHDEKLKPYIKKYGSLAVVLAAITPLPYSWMAILSGTLRMPFQKFFLASLTRIPRFIVYYYAIKLGWLQNLI
jgi:membrane protein YqaA with SNARE-associated domain